MHFLSDYWTYHNCYEIPRNYALWAGVGLLGAVVHKKVCYMHGDLEMTGQMYIGLIGPQGSSKSTCCSFAKEFFREVCPDYSIGPSRASPESLAKTMCEDKFAKAYTNHLGETVEVRPYPFFINEFKNFVGRSPFDMLTFLTDIYDVKMYDATSIARSLEKIINPAINIIVCETPEWIVRNIKGDVISGGFGRRIVYCYEMDDCEDKPLPIITAEARTAIDRCRDRLREARKATGIYKWSPAGFRLYDKWYRDTAVIRRKENNPMMRGYLKSKHVQLFKVMMLLGTVQDKPMYTFNPDLLEEARTYLDIIEPNMLKLAASAGRNELLASQERIKDILTKAGQWVEENWLKRAIQDELTPLEIFSVLKHLEDTEQIVRKQVNFPGRGEKWGFTTPAIREKLLASGDIIITTKKD